MVVSFTIILVLNFVFVFGSFSSDFFCLHLMRVEILQVKCMGAAFGGFFVLLEGCIDGAASWWMRCLLVTTDS